MKYTFVSQRDFENNCRFTSNVEAYAKTQIKKEEYLDLRYATQDDENPDIYTAIYDIFDNFQHKLYSISVTLDTKNNECHSKME